MADPVRSPYLGGSHMDSGRNGPIPQSGDWAVFHAGDKIKCPGFYRTGEKCTATIGEVYDENSVVRVRYGRHNKTLDDWPGYFRVCKECRSLLEVQSDRRREGR